MRSFEGPFRGVAALDTAARVTICGYRRSLIGIWSYCGRRLDDCSAMARGARRSPVMCVNDRAIFSRVLMNVNGF
jgi:hypothetical protein